METRTIFFIGKPGCGKGTQASLLADATGWRVISSGNQFREIAKEDTPIGRKIKSETEAGLLSPHWFAMYLYLKVLFSIHADVGVIFDGFNRKVQEAELVIDSLKWLGRQFTIFNIHVSDEEVQRRLVLRRDAEKRVDDNAVDERLNEYREYTEPAIDMFRKAGALIEINGEQTPEQIASDIRSVLNL